MKQMPIKLKNKLRQLQNLCAKSRKIEEEITKIFEEFELDIGLFNGTNNAPLENSTDTLTFINYAEGDVEDNIKEIERVFLYYVNKNKGDINEKR